MYKNEFIIATVFFFCVTAFFFYRYFLFGHILFPGDLLIAEYNPWKSYSFLGYNPGSYPNKAQYFDVLRQLYPWKLFVIEQLRSLELPLWNPYNFSGSPLLANFQSAVLYPLNIIYAFFSTITAWSILTILQPLFAGVFTYIYSRKINISIYGSALSSISYGFSYFAIVWIGYNTIGHVIAWLPLTLLAIENLLNEKTRVWIFLFVFSIISMIFGGHIQIAAYCILFSFLYLFARIYKQISLSYILFFGTLYLISFGISAIQLIPGIELISQSARSTHNYSFLIEKILIQPYQLIMILIPDFFGNPATRNYSISDTYVGKVLSVGVVALLFAVVSLFSKKNFHTKFFIGSFISIIILVSKNPITQILYSFNIPLVSASAPTLATFLGAFSVSILAGFGLDMWMKSTKENKKIYYAPLLLIIVVLCVWAWLLISTKSVYGAIFQKALLYQTIILIIASVLFYAGLLKKKLLIGIVILLLLVQGGELWRGFHKFNPFVPKDLVFPSTSVITYLKNQKNIDRFWGYKAASVDANFATAYTIFSPEGYDPLYPKRYGEFIHSSSQGKILTEFTTQTRSDAVVSQNEPLMNNKNRLKVLDALGVKYILDKNENASSQVDFPDDRFRRVYTDAGWTLFENKLAVPRYFLTSSYNLFNSAEEFEKKFFSSTFNPKEHLLLEKDISMKLEKDDSAKVTLITYTPKEIIFKTESKTNQLLFLSDTHFPGWKAYIDGGEKEILRAHYTFRAISVPRGDHKVVMRYEPSSVRIGSIVSSISIILLMGMLFFMSKRGIIKE